MAVLDRKKSKVAPLTKVEVKLMKEYEKVCDRMDLANREAALFNCLKIPNDDVKLAVVSCLIYVPIA